MKQKTMPVLGDPIEIPIPTREQFFGDLLKVIGPKKDSQEVSYAQPNDPRKDR